MPTTETVRDISTGGWGGWGGREGDLGVRGTGSRARCRGACASSYERTRSPCRVGRTAPVASVAAAR